MSTNDPVILLERKRYIGGLLEIACQQLEITPTQWKTAETAYNSVTEWLAKCPILGRFDPYLFPHGSGALETTVKPLNQEQFDVDLLGYLRLADDRIPHVWVKNAFGQRLQQYEKQFGPTCSEYKRCWRLEYAEDTKMHLDITPAVNNTTSRFRDLAVPDKELMCWQESNPPDYIDGFRRIAKLRPRLTTDLFELWDQAARADIAPLPGQTHMKGYLRRSIQLVKRHRSNQFEKNPQQAPISVILTTLAMRAYDRLIRENRLYDNEFDIVCDIIALMPEMIERDESGQWLVMNDTTENENFAEKWNKPGSRLSDAFFDWQKHALADFRALADAQDRQEAAAILDRVVGSRTGAAVRRKEASLITEARSRQAVAVGGAGSLTTATGIVVPRNTFFGK